MVSLLYFASKYILVMQNPHFDTESCGNPNNQRTILMVYTNHFCLFWGWFNDGLLLGSDAGGPQPSIPKCRWSRPFRRYGSLIHIFFFGLTSIVSVYPVCVYCIYIYITYTHTYYMNRYVDIRITFTTSYESMVLQVDIYIYIYTYTSYSNPPRARSW